MMFHLLLFVYKGNKDCLNLALNVSQNFLNFHARVYDIIGDLMYCLGNNSVCY